MVDTENKSRLDSWMNALTGLGTLARDKVINAAFGRHNNTGIDDKELSALFHDNDFARKIVTKIVRDSLRRGISVTVEGEESTDIPSSLARYIRPLKFKRKLYEAAIWARVYGGSVIYVGVDDGADDESEPLDLERINSIRFIEVIDRRFITPEYIYGDPTVGRFGEPELYRIQGSFTGRTRGGEDLSRVNRLIHESRIIRFDGALADRYRSSQKNWWGDSVLQAPYDVLRQVGVSFQSLAMLMQDGSQAVFKIKNLISMIAGGDKETLKNRMELVDISRSTARAIMLDADMEQFERQSINLSGVPEVMRLFLMRLAGAANMPLTMLLGQSPAGMNATGESDIRNWYDEVESYQKNELGPCIERFFGICFAAQDFQGDIPDHWEVKFPPLWQPTALEQAQLEKLTAEKDRIYIDSGVILPEEVALNRFKSGGFNPDTQIDIDLREKILMDEQKALLENKDQPEPKQKPDDTRGS